MIICKFNSGIAVLITLTLFATPVLADRDSDDHDRGSRNKYIKAEKHEEQERSKKSGRYEIREKQERREERNEYERIYKERGYTLDKRYNHNHYYPPRGYKVPELPKRYRVVPYRGVDYYFHSGIWYHRAGLGFSVVFPPVGIVTPVLPPYYTTIWVGATPYYYAGGIYYVWRPSAYGYEVVEAPAETEIDLEPSTPTQLFIYPKEGQSEEQQATDRFECHHWAMEQTDFDPTQPHGNVPVEQYENKRADYHRAMTVCLEGRGYSVK